MLDESSSSNEDDAASDVPKVSNVWGAQLSWREMVVKCEQVAEVVVKHCYRPRTQ